MDMAYDDRQERRLALAFLLVAWAGLLLGGLSGMALSIEHTGIPVVFPQAELFYQSLTLHQTLAGMVWPLFFASGFLLILLTRALGRPSLSPALSWLGFVLMVAGAVLIILFYLTGTTLGGWLVLAVGTWLHSLNCFLTWRSWRRVNPAVRTPLGAFTALAAWTLWDFASLSTLIEVAFFTSGTVNLLLVRTLGWVLTSGLNGFMLVAAAGAWFAVMPRQAGGKLTSEPLARTVIVLLVLLTLPSSLSQHYADPGISAGWKALHMVMAYGVIFAGLIAAFVLMATMEYSARARGARGMLFWPFRLAWGDPGFTAQFLAITVYTLALIGTAISASYTMGLVVQNTLWTSGQMHLMAGTAVTLTFMGVTHWLLPYLTGRSMSRALGLLQVFTWFAGALLLSGGMLWAGLMDAPSGIPFSMAADINAALGPLVPITTLISAGGGGLMLLSALLYFLNVLGGLLGRKALEPVDAPLADSVGGVKDEAVPERWGGLIGTAIVLIALGLGPIILGLLR